MKYLMKFENYVETDPIHFEEAFEVDELYIAGILSELIDTYEYLDFDLLTDDYDKFTIEIFEEGLENDPTQDLEDEYRIFQENILENLKLSLRDSGLELIKHEYDKGRKRIIIEVKRMPIKESADTQKLCKWCFKKFTANMSEEFCCEVCEGKYNKYQMSQKNKIKK